MSKFATEANSLADGLKEYANSGKLGKDLVGLAQEARLDQTKPLTVRNSPLGPLVEKFVDHLDTLALKVQVKLDPERPILNADVSDFTSKVPQPEGDISPKVETRPTQP